MNKEQQTKQEAMAKAWNDISPDDRDGLNTFAHGFDVGFELARPKWKVIERDGLPDEAGWYLAIRVGVETAWPLYYDGRGGWYDSPKSQLPTDKRNVSKWMEIPKEDEQNGK